MVGIPSVYLPLDRWTELDLSICFTRVHLPPHRKCGEELGSSLQCYKIKKYSPNRNQIRSTCHLMYFNEVIAEDAGIFLFVSFQR